MVYRHSILWQAITIFICDNGLNTILYSRSTHLPVTVLQLYGNGRDSRTIRVKLC